jgi:pimeloyl-ACP methyl ester carboxylesterase
MDRRKFLAYSSASAIASLYGCAQAPIHNLPEGDITDDKYLVKRGLRVAVFSDRLGREPIFGTMHGIGINKSALEPFNAVFRSMGNQTIGFDLPGHGDSDAIPYKKITVAQLAELHEESLKRHGIGNYVGVGHSTGGMVMLEHALRYPNRYSGLVLMNAVDVNPVKLDYVNSFVYNAGTNIELNDFRYQFEQNGSERRAYDFSKGMSGEEAYRMGKRHSDPDSVRTIVEAFKDFDVRSQVGQLQFPILVIRGMEDKAIPPLAVEEMANRFSNVRLVDVPKGQFWFVHYQSSVKDVVLPHYHFFTGTQSK